MTTNSMFVAAALAGLVSVAYAGEAIDIGQTLEFQGSQTHAVVPVKSDQAVVPLKSDQAVSTRSMGAAGSGLDRATVRAEAIQAARDGKIQSGEIGAD